MTDPQLSEIEQLEVLGSYIDAHYPLPPFTPPWKAQPGDTVDAGPADGWSARLPDRLTHAAMLQLGAGLNHAMPGVAYTQDVPVREVPEVSARLYGADWRSATWAVSFHSGGWWRGSGDALELQWRPEVAAAASLSGVPILDVDYPLAPEHTLPEIIAAAEAAVDYARGQGADAVVGWGYSSGGALAVALAPLVDALVLTFPDLDSVPNLPDELRGGVTLAQPQQWPRSLVQIALADEVAAVPEGLKGNDQVPSQITVHRFVARHRVSTPAVARARIRDVAEFLESVHPDAQAQE